MTLKEFVTFSQKALESKSLHYADSRQHVEQLITRALDWSSADILLKQDDSLSAAHEKILVDVLNRRLAGEPLQYILGFEWFYRSRFEVGPGCLIPRKETELIVDEVLKHRSGEKIRVAELGAGSGNIGISVLLERPQVEWHAFELNPASFDFAQKNQRKILNQSASYRLYQGDFFSESPAHGPYDVVVSNPPYVSFKEMEELPLEVKKEPALALEAGEDGLTIIRRLLDHLPVVLKSKGLFLCEIGSNQKQELERELKTRKFPDFEILSDLSGLPRILKLLVQ